MSARFPAQCPCLHLSPSRLGWLVPKHSYITAVCSNRLRSTKPSQIARTSLLWQLRFYVFFLKKKQAVDTDQTILAAVLFFLSFLFLLKNPPEKSNGNSSPDAENTYNSASRIFKLHGCSQPAVELNISRLSRRNGIAVCTVALNEPTSARLRFCSLCPYRTTRHQHRIFNQRQAT